MTPRSPHGERTAPPATHRPARTPEGKRSNPWHPYGT